MLAIPVGGQTVVVPFASCLPEFPLLLVSRFIAFES